MPEMPMTIAKILAAVHPNTSPVVSGRASCRKQILRELFAIINAIVEDGLPSISNGKSPSETEAVVCSATATNDIELGPTRDMPKKGDIHVKDVRNVPVLLGEVLPAWCRVYAPDGSLIAEAPMENGKSQNSEPIHFPAGGEIQIDFRKTTSPDIVFVLKQDITYGD